MDGREVRGKELVLQEAVAVLERHIEQIRVSHAGAAVSIGWEEFLDVFGLDPNEPEHFRLIFEAAEARSPADEFGRDVLRFGREDEPLQPVLQPHVVRYLTKQRHGGVRVGINETGGEDRVGPVEPLLRLKPRIDFGLRSDAGDPISANRHRAVLENAALGIHGDYVASAPDLVGGLGAQSRGREDEETTGTKHRKDLGTGRAGGALPSCRPG